MVVADKNTFIRWAAKQPQLPVFFQPWYLDAVCSNGQWQAHLYQNDKGTIEGVLVYYLTTKYKRQVINMPMLTPYSGIWMPPATAEKEVYKTRNINKIVAELAHSIPSDVVLYRQSFLPEFNNWMAFYWQRYFQTTRYTFVIEDLKQWSLNDAATNVRNKINKASALITITEDIPLEKVYQMADDILTQKGIQLQWKQDAFMRWDEVLNKHSKRFIVGAKDSDGRVHATAYVIVDQATAYLMILASDKVLRKSGAVPLVIYHAIMKAAKVATRFDFEGSMLASLFDLFSGFGGKLTPYHSIYKTKNLFWQLAYHYKMRKDNLNR